jgi:type IV pilus assembly protein PilC
MKNIISDYKLLQRFVTFCLKLKSLLASGISIQAAIKIILQDEQDHAFKGKITNLLTSLESGKSFIHSLKSVLPRNIPFNFLQIETLPDIPILLEKLAFYYKNKLTMIKKFLSKLTYPACLILSIFIIFILFFSVLLPSFSSFYTDLSMSIPKPIQLLLNLSNIIQSYLLEISIFIGIICLIIYYIFSDKIKTKLYNFLFPDSTQDILWIMSILLSSGIKMKDAVTCLNLQTNSSLQKPFNQFKHNFLQSGDFAESFNKAFTLSSYQKELLIHSQKTATIPQTFLEIASDLKIQEQKRIDTKLAIIQPALLLFIGGLIFLFIYFTFLPVLSSIQNI